MSSWNKFLGYSIMTLVWLVLMPPWIWACFWAEEYGNRIVSAGGRVEALWAFVVLFGIALGGAAIIGLLLRGVTNALNRRWRMTR